MSNCRSGCRSKDHTTYGECLQAANVRVAATINSPLAFAYDKTKGDLAAYQAARANGIQPEGTTVQKVREAENASRLLGRPYNAERDAPASMIVSKNTARFANIGD